MVAKWSQKFLEKIGTSGICGKTIPHIDDKESNITSIDISEMNEEQLHEKLYQGYADYKNGKIQIAEVAFVQFKNRQC